MKKVEYIIVGQGFSGTLISYQLHKRGINHLIIDNKLEKSATKVAAGLMNPIVFKRLTKSWQADILVEYVKNTYPKIEQQTKSKFFKEIPIGRIFTNQEEQNNWEIKKDVYGFDKYLGKIDFTQKETINSPFGIGLVKNSFVIDTKEFLKAWKNFVGKDVLLEKIFDYEKLKINNNKFEYEDYQANRIIFCEGSQYINNPFFDWLPFKLTKGEVLTIKAPGTDINFIPNKGFFMLPKENNTFKVGATYEWDDLSYNITEKAKKELTNKIESVLKTPYTITNQKAGIRPTVVDRKSIVGSHPKHENIYVFNGLGTKGGLIAPWLTEKFVKYLLEKEELPKEISVERFYSKYFKD